MEKELELRMYFFVPYNISPIQQAIQAGHAALEYANEYGDTELFKKFMLHKTWIILNGGTTNPKLKDEFSNPRTDVEPYKGTLDNICHNLYKNGITQSIFHEPDLNDALTAVCFICDERVFNYEDYPDIMDFAAPKMEKIEWLKTFKDGPFTYKEIKDQFPKIYKDWEDSLGGSKNVFLRELLKSKKLA